MATERPILSVPKINFLFSGTPCDSYTLVAVVSPGAFIFPFQPGIGKPELGGKFLYTPTLSELNALAFFCGTNIFDKTAKAKINIKNHNEITASLLSLSRRQASCQNDKAGFEICSLALEFCAPTMTKSSVFAAIISLLIANEHADQ